MVTNVQRLISTSATHYLHPAASAYGATGSHLRSALTSVQVYCYLPLDASKVDKDQVGVPRIYTPDGDVPSTTRMNLHIKAGMTVSCRHGRKLPVNHSHIFRNSF